MILLILLLLVFWRAWSWIHTQKHALIYGVIVLFSYLIVLFCIHPDDVRMHLLNNLLDDHGSIAGILLLRVLKDSLLLLRFSIHGSKYLINPIAASTASILRLIESIESSPLLVGPRPTLRCIHDFHVML